jgi:hypothetical protein
MAWMAPVIRFVPVPVMPAPQADTNLSPIIFRNGSLIGLYRTWPGGAGTPEVGSRIHLLRATSWKEPTTYTWDDTVELFPGMPTKGTEDPFLYQDIDTGVFHAVFHHMASCFVCGGHASSVDGVSWQYSPGNLTLANATYNDTIHCVDGTSLEAYRRERPHFLFNRTSGE